MLLLQELKILVHVFRAPNKIVHLTFRAPRIAVRARVDANVYLTVRLIQR